MPHPRLRLVLLVSSSCLVVALASRPVHTQPQVTSPIRYAELVGMFTHAMGIMTDQTGALASQWAWGHDLLPEGCSNLHWWDLRTYTYSHYEQFCERGDWVRLMAYGGADGSLLHIETDGGEAGQRYAPALLQQRVAFCEEGQFTDGGFPLTFSDCQTWSPTADGLSWTQHETFSYLTGPADILKLRFTAVSRVEPRKMFAEAHRVWDWGGVLIADGPVRTVETRTW